MSYFKRIMLLGSGELGRELTIAAKRLGCFVIAVGRYNNAPAMQVADVYEVIDMMNSYKLNHVVNKYKPDIIIPEIEAINIECLFTYETTGIKVVPSARAVEISMNRKALRLVASKIGLKTAKYCFAMNKKELEDAVINNIGVPCVVKPLMSSSGKGQTIINSPDEIETAWNNLTYARGGGDGMIVEEFINFEDEITMLTVSEKNGGICYCNPIGHYQEHGDYQESWQPHKLTPNTLEKAKSMCAKIIKELTGQGIWGVEFFVTANDLYFSEISPRPHDTGLVTLSKTQELNQFELHLYAILGLHISTDANNMIKILRNGSSKSINSNSNFIDNYQISGIEKCVTKNTAIHLFSKPVAYKNRRLGVILAWDDDASNDTPIKVLRKITNEKRKHVQINFKNNI